MDSNKDLNVYKKVGRKYVPIGYRIEDNYLNDGIWIVHHKPGSTQITRGDYLADSYGLIKVGDIAKIDLPKLGAMEEYAEVVANTIGNLKGRLTNIDIARRIVKELFEYNEKLKNK